MELDEELDALFAAPLDDFVRVRNERAAALRKEGQRALSAAVKEQAKPTLTAWVVNQLARRRRAEVDELLEVGDRLRRAHQAALKGTGKEGFDEARRAERELVAMLVREAERVLEESGRAAAPGTLERISRTLRAAPADEEGRELLAKGRFVSDFEPTGFEALAGLRLPTSRPARRPAPSRPAAAPAERGDAQAERAARRAEVRQARQALADARAGEQAVRRRLRDAERRAERAREAAERAEQELEALRREAAEAAEAATAAEETLSTLQRSTTESGADV